MDEIAEAVGGDGKVPIAIDGITTETTISCIAKIIRPGGDLALLLPIKPGDSLVDSSSGAEVYMVLNSKVNPLPNGVKYVGIRAFLAEQVGYVLRCSYGEADGLYRKIHSSGRTSLSGSFQSCCRPVSSSQIVYVL